MPDDNLSVTPWPHEPSELRWAIDVSDWEPGTREWFWLLRLLPPREQLEVHALGLEPKLALVSRLLQRKCIATMLGGQPWDMICIDRTKGGKPFDATKGRSKLSENVSNLNFNVSHNDGLIVIASDPALLIGVHVSPPLRESFDRIREDFDGVMSEAEWEAFEALPSEAARKAAFRKHLAVKQAFVKARGDGLSFPLETCEPHFEGQGSATSGGKTSTAVAPAPLLGIELAEDRRGSGGSGAGGSGSRGGDDGSSSEAHRGLRVLWSSTASISIDDEVCGCVWRHSQRLFETPCSCRSRHTCPLATATLSHTSRRCSRYGESRSSASTGRKTLLEALRALGALKAYGCLQSLGDQCTMLRTLSATSVRALAVPSCRLVGCHPSSPPSSLPPSLPSALPPPLPPPSTVLHEQHHPSTPLPFPRQVRYERASPRRRCRSRCSPSQVWFPLTCATNTCSRPHSVMSRSAAHQSPRRCGHRLPTEFSSSRSSRTRSHLISPKRCIQETLGSKSRIPAIGAPSASRCESERGVSQRGRR